MIKSALNRRSPAGQPRSWPALFTHHPPAMTSRPVCSERALPFLPPLHSSCSRCHRSQTTNLHCALLLASCVFEQTPIACSVCPFLHCTLFEHCHIHRSLWSRRARARSTISISFTRSQYLDQTFPTPLRRRRCLEKASVPSSREHPPLPFPLADCLAVSAQRRKRCQSLGPFARTAGPRTVASRWTLMTRTRP